MKTEDYNERDEDDEVDGNDDDDDDVDDDGDDEEEEHTPSAKAFNIWLSDALSLYMAAPDYHHNADHFQWDNIFISNEMIFNFYSF